jgi:hypothetical protein
MSVMTRSEAWVCVRSLAGIAVRIPPRVWVSVCCECCVLSATVLCVGSTTRSEQSWAVCVYVCVCVCVCVCVVFSAIIIVAQTENLFHIFSSFYFIPYLISIHVELHICLSSSLVVNMDVMLVVWYNCVYKIITDLYTLMSDNMPLVSLML